MTSLKKPGHDYDPTQSGDLILAVQKAIDGAIVGNDEYSPLIIGPDGRLYVNSKVAAMPAVASQVGRSVRSAYSRARSASVHSTTHTAAPLASSP